MGGDGITLTPKVYLFLQLAKEIHGLEDGFDSSDPICKLFHSKIELLIDMSIEEIKNMKVDGYE